MNMKHETKEEEKENRNFTFRMLFEVTSIINHQSSINMHVFNPSKILSLNKLFVMLYFRLGVDQCLDSTNGFTFS